MALVQRQNTVYRTPPSAIADTGAARAPGTWSPAEEEAPVVPSSPCLRTFAGGIAHNFNNLLTIILGNAALVGDSLPPDSPLRGMLQQIEAAVYSAENLTQQMLLYAQRSQPFPEPLDLTRLIEDLEGRFKACVGSNIAVEYDLKPELPSILVDQGQMRRLLTSLFFNAAEAIGDQPGVIGLRTQAVYANRAFLGLNGQADLPEGRYVWLQVSDDGCGMDEETRQHIFEPFYSTKFVGRGLGLCAALGIVRQHRGVIWVATKKGTGTVVNLLLACAGTI